MKDLRISLVQAATLWHDAEGNRELYGGLVRPLAGGTDLVILPETFTSGFSNDAVEMAEGADGPTLDWLRTLAADTGAVVTGSIVTRDDGSVFNRLVWMRPDGSHSHYDKRHLFRMAREHERYAPGRDRIVVELHGWRVCPVVCYDLRFPVFLRNRWDSGTGHFDYDLLVCVANWPAPRAYAWKTLLRARAMENLACVAGVNRVAEDGNGIPYAGDSVLLDALGQPLVELGREPQVVTAVLPAAPLHAHRERFPAHLDADAFELRR